MTRLLDMGRALAAKRWLRWVAVPAAAAAVIGSVISATTPPSIPAIALAAEPLYAKGARAKPTLTLALSVEFPTVGAQYVKNPGDTEDDSYSPDLEYLGYFDANSCYTYNDGNGNADLRRFDRSGAATGHKCAGAGFSGNFMNWATSSAIDILRYGLTGGDRWQDTSTLTVLQRAVLPNSSVSGNFWNASNFPAKKLYAALAGDAVPDNLRGTYTGDIFVANCLNRVHFGTAKGGNCASPGNNSNLGVNPPGTVGVITSYTGTLPGDFSSACAAENGVCTFTGTKQVAYGANSSWFFMSATGSVNCNNATFGDPLNGTVKACYTRDVPSNPYATAQLTPDQFFYTRVSVCGVDGSGNLTDPRADFCLRYPNGNYKPVGNLQKYSDRVRVAAFGYLNDNTGNPNERNGGVLRAPMKYVGPKYFDGNFSLVSGANPAQEWSETTGVFTRDPDSAGGPNSGTGSNWPGQAMSGVANYLNQFGRTGTFGQYKTYDPVGELYYEAVRYIQGLGPTSSAVSSITDTLRDGFPVYTSWTDPHPAVTGMTDYSCVKNNIVGIGDVNTHNDKYIPGNDRTANDNSRSSSDASNEPDFKFWTKVVGGFESNTSVSYTDGAGVARTTANISANSPYNSARWGMETQNIGADGAAYYMAGIAYWANTHDIRGTNWTSNTTAQRPGMRLKTYWLDVNEYGNQTNATTRRNNQFFLTAKYGGFKDVTGTGNPFKVKNEDGSISDGNANWNKTDQPLEAKNYYLSSSAAGVLSALNEIFANIAQEAASIAGGAISTQRLTSVGGVIYQAQFDPADWSGDLIAYPVTASGTTVTIGQFADSPWRNAANQAAGASAKLDERVGANGSAHTSRKIYVGKTNPNAAFAADEFVWGGSLEATLKNWLKTPPGNTTATATDSDAIAEDRLNFLRGDRRKESPAGTLRKRGSVLGDIVNSGVAYSGAPSTAISDSSYGAFQTANATRTKALFVGANDGMLHAFNADTGAELFAYIPSWLIPKLNLLTSGSYQHRSYLDATPVVGEAKVGSSWKTVLVGGTGGGGQGIYALDVTNPDPAGTGGFSASNVMWEFTDADDADLGNVVGRPQILKFNTAAPGSTPSYKYFAVVASGVNNYVDDGRYSTDGGPAIFLLDLSTGKADNWVLGTNYFKIKLPVNDSSIASGLINFTVRTGFVDEVTQLYAGDLHGNLWKFDFGKAGFSTWGSSTDVTVARNKLSYFNTGGGSPVAIPMYIARDAQTTPKRQPISMAPALVFNTKGNIVVGFGTGKFLETPDSAGPHGTQSVYAVLDNADAAADSGSLVATSSSAISGRGRLIGGTVSSGTISVADFTWGRPLTDADASKRSGWYFDFPTSSTTGERQISNFGILAGQLIFGTVIPAVNSCDNGSGKLYAIDALSGDGNSEVSTVGMLGEPFLTQVGDSSKTNSDTTGKRQESARWQVILQGSSGIAAPAGLGKDIVSYFGRLSWREIFNYQELKQ